jgi:type IV pilus assembly protein PilQ
MKKNMLWRILQALSLSILFIGCATAPRVKESASADDFAVITGITLQNDGLAIMSNKNFVYTIYKSNDPYKITVDIPDMKTGAFKDKIVADKAGITEITPQQIDSPKPAVKINIVLQAPSSVTPFYKDNALTLVIKSDVVERKAGEPHEVAAAPEPSSDVSEADPPTPEEKTSDDTKTSEEKLQEKPESSVPSMSKATEIRKIEFKKIDDTVSVLITGNGAMMPNVFPIDERIVVDIPGVSLHAPLPAYGIFPLKGMRAGRYKNKIRLVLDLKKKTAYDVEARGNTIEISFKRRGYALTKSSSYSPPKEAARLETTQKEMAQNTYQTAVEEMAPEKAPAKEITSANGTVPSPGKYNGKRISLDFQDAEIGPIFRLLADVNGYNLVLDPSVKGKITIKLMNVPWDQALDIILNTFNLGARIEGNILWIAPASTFAKIAEEGKKTKEQQESTEELTQEVIRVNYASAGDLSAAISQGKLLSQRGSITIDARMNTLIIKDTRRSIEKIRELVLIMDVAKPQVMIEAKLVQVNTDYSQTLGIRWGGSFSNPRFPTPLSGNFSVNTPTIQAGPSAVIPGGALDLTVGHANSLKVNLSLSALESISKAKTLSNPKVMTMDNEAATIQQGRTFFIATVSQAGTQTQSQTATLSLSVTPKITPDGYVQLKVTATDNSLEPGTAGANAVVDTKSLTTQALVKNGETLVLGGIYTTDYTEEEDRVPFLGRVPILGWLFKTKQTTGPTVRELLIFITPTIMSQQTL